MTDPAPLFTDSYDLAAWLLGRLDREPSRLGADICRLALGLLDAVTEGLRARDDPSALLAADDLLRRLRLRLRLAGETGLLDERRMRSLRGALLERIACPETLWQAARAAFAGKRRGPAVARELAQLDRTCFALSRELLGGGYRPRGWRLRIVHDPKPRLIAAPAVRDRIVHRALIGVIGPTFSRRAIDAHFTRGPGGGLHQALLQLLAMNRRHRWRMHLDVARYFPSVDHGILSDLLFERIADQRVQALIQSLLASGLTVYRSPEARRLGLGPPAPDAPPRGLPLGSWLSQWAGAYYLDGLDHFVKRVLKVPGYLRYMDDFVLFSDDRAQLLGARPVIMEWLLAQRSLRLNPKHGDIVPTRHPATLLGHRVSHAGITPAGRMRRRMDARIATAAEQGADALERTLSSYRGLMWIR
jgi:hypothetical protein